MSPSVDSDSCKKSVGEGATKVMCVLGLDLNHVAQNDLELVLLGEKTLNLCASSLVLCYHMFLFIRSGNRTHGLLQAKQALHG